jgi:hypothetical protein
MPLDRTFPGKAALVALLLTASLPASAAVIYDGGAPDQGGTIYSQAPAAVAMDFSLAAGSNVVGGANWWGGCYPATACGSSPDFQISFYADSGSGPGTLIKTFDAGTANQTATGKQIGIGPSFDEYAYSATFAPLTLAAATTYWFSITETATEPAGTWGTETTSTAPAGSSAYSINIVGSTWTPLVETLGFQLTSQPVSVPEPSAVSLLGVGLAAVGFVRRRRAV